MASKEFNFYNESFASRRATLVQTGVASISPITNLSFEVDATQKTEPAVKEFSTYRNPDTFLEDVASRYKI